MELILGPATIVGTNVIKLFAEIAAKTFFLIGDFHGLFGIVYSWMRAWAVWLDGYIICSIFDHLQHGQVLTVNLLLSWEKVLLNRPQHSFVKTRPNKFYNIDPLVHTLYVHKVNRKKWFWSVCLFLDEVHALDWSKPCSRMDQSLLLMTLSSVFFFLFLLNFEIFSRSVVWLITFFDVFRNSINFISMLLAFSDYFTYK